MQRSSVSLILSLMILAGCGGSGDSASSGSATDPGQSDAVQADTGDASAADAGASGASTNSDDELSAAPVLEPVFSFTLEAFDLVNQVALSPDGSSVVAASQSALGDPVTLQFYDTSTGEQTGTVEFETIGIGRMHWMADNRLVILNTGLEGQWRSWDGTSLEELASFPVDDTCADGVADKSTGAVYSSDGLTSVGDNICRFDTTDGSLTRTPEGLLVLADQYWVRPGANELVVVHSPDEDVARELMVLDGATFDPTSRTELPFNESVSAVAGTTWIVDFDAGTNRLEPGAIPVPDIRDPLQPSGAGTLFFSSNGMDDLLFISASDGSVVGVLPAGMNPSSFSDWSIDDSTLVRATVDGDLEVYHF